MGRRCRLLRRLERRLSRRLARRPECLRTCCGMRAVEAAASMQSGVRGATRSNDEESEETADRRPRSRLRSVRIRGAQQRVRMRCMGSQARAQLSGGNMAVNSTLARDGAAVATLPTPHQPSDTLTGSTHRERIRQHTQLPRQDASQRFVESATVTATVDVVATRRVSDCNVESRAPETRDRQTGTSRASLHSAHEPSWTTLHNRAAVVGPRDIDLIAER